MPEGPGKNKVVDLKPMLDEYYRAWGWDVLTGLQKRSILERLGLKGVADELGRMSRLAK